MTLLIAFAHGIFAAAQFMLCVALCFAGALLLWSEQPVSVRDWRGTVFSFIGCLLIGIGVGMMILLYRGAL